MLRRPPLGQKNLTAPRRWCPLPGDMKDAIGSLCAIDCPFWFFRKDWKPAAASVDTFKDRFESHEASSYFMSNLVSQVPE
jgi:hypothetical protein